MPVQSPNCFEKMREMPGTLQILSTNYQHNSLLPIIPVNLHDLTDFFPKFTGSENRWSVSKHNINQIFY
jgi:hypothetical protein